MEGSDWFCTMQTFDCWCDFHQTLFSSQQTKSFQSIKNPLTHNYYHNYKEFTRTKESETRGGAGEDMFSRSNIRTVRQQNNSNKSDDDRVASYETIQHSSFWEDKLDKV